MDPLACLLMCLIDPQMLAPIIGGLLFDFVGYSFAALFIAVWNLVSVIVEYMLLIRIYRFVITSDLSAFEICPMIDNVSLFFLLSYISFLPQSHICISCREFPELARKDHLQKLKNAKDSFRQKLKRSLDSWVMFYRHPVFFAGIALASTYMTVLALHNGT